MLTVGGFLILRISMIEIKLTQGKVALIDDEDFERLNQWKWFYMKSSASRTGYAVGSNNGATIRMHRLIMNAKKDEVLDHINGNGLDNCKHNLRFVTVAENQWNRHRKGFGTSKYVGVNWQSKNKKWRAQIRHNGEKVYLGEFKNELDAVEAYDKAVIKYRGCLGRVNLNQEERR